MAKAVQAKSQRDRALRAFSACRLSFIRALATLLERSFCPIRLVEQPMESITPKTRERFLEAARLAGEWYLNCQNTPEHPWGGVDESADEGRFLYEYFPTTGKCRGMGVWGQALAAMGLTTLARRVRGGDRYRKAAILAGEYLKSLQMLEPLARRLHRRLLRAQSSDALVLSARRRHRRHGPCCALPRDRQAASTSTARGFSPTGTTTMAATRTVGHTSNTTSPPAEASTPTPAARGSKATGRRAAASSTTGSTNSPARRSG